MAGRAGAGGRERPGVDRRLVLVGQFGATGGDHLVEVGDDLRRFLRGQLVAAHRYSSRQRLVRWLRRNRAAIAVGTTPR